jgi:hypothetical protein
LTGRGENLTPHGSTRYARSCERSPCKAVATWLRTSAPPPAWRI